MKLRLRFKTFVLSQPLILLKWGIAVIELTNAISELPGIGPKRQVAFNKLAINTIYDLLTYYPRKYNDFAITDLTQAQDGQRVVLKGIVASEPTLNYYGRQKNRVSFQLLANDQLTGVTFFNQPWLKKQLVLDEGVMIAGTFNQLKNQVTGIKMITKDNLNRYESIYPGSKELTSKQIGQYVKMAFDKYENLLTEVLPTHLIQKYRLETFHDTIKNIHFPSNDEDAKKALRTAKFLELFTYAMNLERLKQQSQTTNPKAQIKYQETVVQQFIAELPYALTAAQQRVINEILQNLKAPVEMNRLLQGDVGSGKTIVAACAMLATITANKQAVIMAPTEILAEQHANNLFKLFEQLPINVALLTGSTKAAAKKQLLPRIKSGEIDLIVGTHALFQAGVDYHDLGLLVIDEQHRFGVNQREALKKKAANPNVLSMTATPIPRTLALTTYGEMAVSVIDELPNGRKQIETSWVNTSQSGKVFNFLKEQLANGHQAYVVAPLIEESEALEMKNATEIYERFVKLVEPTYKVGLLHGQMSVEEKDTCMQKFKNNEYQLLVATTVIEVGVDVANANTMVILNAEHYGLSQLHQLRGRVGRGTSQAYCILIANPKTEIAKERLQAITESTDGFYLSQRDLELRGQGDVSGLKQSGVPDFKIADPIGDLPMLVVANQEAKKIVNEPDWQTKLENVQLVRYLNANSK